jgi:hypothetical protein
MLVNGMPHRPNYWSWPIVAKKSVEDAKAHYESAKQNEKTMVELFRSLDFTSESGAASVHNRPSTESQGEGFGSTGS